MRSRRKYQGASIVRTTFAAGVVVFAILSGTAAGHVEGVVTHDGLVYYNCHELLGFQAIPLDKVAPHVPSSYHDSDDNDGTQYDGLDHNDDGDADLYVSTRFCERITVGGVEVRDAVDSHVSVFIKPPKNQQPPPHASSLFGAPLEVYLIQWVTNNQAHATWLTQGTGLGDKVKLVPNLVYEYDPMPGHDHLVPGAVDDDFRLVVGPPASSPFEVAATVYEPTGSVSLSIAENWWADTDEGTVIIHAETFEWSTGSMIPGRAEGTITADDPESPLGKMLGDKPRPFCSDIEGNADPTCPQGVGDAVASSFFTGIQLTKCVRNAFNPCSAEDHPPGTDCNPNPCSVEGDLPSETDDCSSSNRRELLTAEQRAVLELVGDLTTLRDHADLAALAAVGYKDYDHYFVSFAGQGLAILDLTRFADVRPGNPSLLLYEPSPDAADVTDIDGPDFPYSLAGWGYAGPNYGYDKQNQRPVYPTDLADLCLGAGDWFVHERGIHPADTGGMHSVPPKEEQEGEEEHGHASGDTFPIPGVEGPVGFSHPRIWDIHLWLGTDGVPSISILNPGRCIPGIPSDVGVAWFHPEDDQREVGREHCAVH